MVILHNVQTMSHKLKKLQNCGYPIDDSILRALSPYAPAISTDLGTTTSIWNGRLGPWTLLQPGRAS